MKYNNTNRKGQIILFAVVGVTIALALGVSVASRNLSSLSRVSRGDTSERAFAAAEGGIEKLLILTGAELDTVAGGNCSPIVGSTKDDVTGMCNMKYPVTGGDPIESTADMKVEYYNSNADYSGTPYLTLDINNGDSVEVLLSDATTGANKYSGTVYLCWENKDAALYYSMNDYDFGNSGTYKFVRNALRSNTDFTDVSNTSNGGFVDVTAANYGFVRCASFNFVGTYDALRIRAMYDSTLVGIFSTTPLPVQGYKLTSYGKISSSGSEIVKKVVVYRSYPFMPSILDAAIFSPEGPVN
jgi:hypothetical protein